MRSRWFVLAPVVLLLPGMWQPAFAPVHAAGVPKPAAPASPFKKFTSTEGKLSLLLPGTPKKEVQTVAGLTVVAYGVNVKNGAYAVAYSNLPPGINASNQSAALSGAVMGITNSHGKGKVLSEKDITLGGGKGKEFESEIPTPKGYVSGRVIVANGRLYQVFAIGTDARLSKPEVRKFIDSFKITK